MTDNELQTIVEAVLESLKTNGKTIEQLTAVTTMGTNDYIELNGGRKVKYSVLYDQLYTAAQAVIEASETEMWTAINAKANKAGSSSQDFAADDLVANTLQVLGDIIAAGSVSVTDPNIGTVEIAVGGEEGSETLTITGESGKTITLPLGSAEAGLVLATSDDISNLMGILNNLSRTVQVNGAQLDLLSNRVAAMTSSIEALEVALGALAEVYCTEAEYNQMIDSGSIDPNIKYFIYES